MNTVFFEKFECFIVLSPESQIFDTVLFVLNDFLLKRGDVLGPPVISAFCDTQFLQSVGPGFRIAIFSIIGYKAPGD